MGFIKQAVCLPKGELCHTLEKQKQKTINNNNNKKKWDHMEAKHI